jgi:hypothetical protein
MAKPKPPDSPYVAVDVWTLRCLLKRSNYVAKIAANEFIELFRWDSKVRANGSRTVQVYYGPPTRELMTILQWFESADGTILRSGFKDPKRFYSVAHHIDYHQHGGEGWWRRFRRSPESILGEWDDTTRTSRLIISIQRVYGSWRRWKCCWLGPVETYRHQLLIWGRGLFGV